jgi:DNA-binding response OmpR family regulator
MSDVLLATDADWLFDDVAAALGGSHDVHRVRDGALVGPAVEQIEPKLVILDLQVGNMGGVATSIFLKQEVRAGRLPETPVLLLLDRKADEFLATQSDADAWLTKPLNSLELSRAANELVNAEQ